MNIKNNLEGIQKKLDLNDENISKENLMEKFPRINSLDGIILALTFLALFFSSWIFNKKYLNLSEETSIYKILLNNKVINLIEQKYESNVDSIN